MAWIPYCKELPGKPEVARIAKLSGRSIRETVAILLEFWGWCDEQFDVDASVHRDVDLFVHHGVDLELTEIVRGTDANWWKAVSDVGWIRFTEDGQMVIPHFGRWMGESAKKRLRNTLKHNRWLKKKSRVDASIDDSIHQPRCTKPSQKRVLQNRTEQNSKEEEGVPTVLLSAGADASTNGYMGPSASVLQEAWNRIVVKGQRCEVVSGKRAVHLKNRNRDPYFREHWQAALAKIAESPFCCGDNQRGWVATIDWFLRPDTVLKLIEGFYDGREPAAKGGFLAELYGGKA